jgi:hypothetical protein
VNWQHCKRRPAAKTILRDYINATIGFAELAEATNIPSKSLMRMLGPSGNPRADNLLEVLRLLQQREGVRFLVKTSPLLDIDRRQKEWQTADFGRETGILYIPGSLVVCN